MPVATRVPSSSPFPQPVTGLAAALIVLAVVIFVLPPGARLWVAAFAIVLVLFYRGRNAAGIIDTLRTNIYGPSTEDLK